MKASLDPTQENYLKLLEIAETVGETRSQEGSPSIRLAILSDNAPQRLARVLLASLHLRGCHASLYEAGIDTSAQEALDQASGAHGFEPEYLLLNTCSQVYRERFYKAPHPARAAFAQLYLDEMLHLARPFQARGTRVIFSTLAPLEERLFGNYSALTEVSLYRSLLDYNRLLCDKVRSMPGSLLNDVMAIAMREGLVHWYDHKLWFSARYLCAPKYLVSLAENLAALIQTARGQMTKCVVVDLDNVLWGGRVADDGISGLDLGDTPTGKAFQCFQQQLKELRDRGVLLAACSKNDMEDALAPFRQHPGMVLKEEDFSAIEANWEDKASNLRRIAADLNVGLDSLIFVDDSPFERAQVAASIPDIGVPDIPADPSLFLSSLEGKGLFETLWHSEDDRTKAEQLRASRAHAQELSQAADLPGFLKGLRMKLQCRQFDETHLPRIAQLLAKTNQFNLRTQRLSEVDCARFMKEQGRYLPLYFKLEDRLGDHGLVSVLCAELQADTAFILEFVLSCRVFKRGLEHAALNCLVEHCRRRGVKTIVGEYRPTEKNGLVANLYQECGFQRSPARGPVQRWELEVVKFKTLETFVSEIE